MTVFKNNRRAQRGRGNEGEMFGNTEVPQQEYLKCFLLHQVHAYT